jgi:hypothetical protein
MKEVQAYLFRGPFNGNPVTSLYIPGRTDVVEDCGCIEDDIILKEESGKVIKPAEIVCVRTPPKIMEAIKSVRPHTMWGIEFDKDSYHIGDPLIDFGALSELMVLKGTDSYGRDGTIQDLISRAHKPGTDYGISIIPGEEAVEKMHGIIEGAMSQFPPTEAEQGLLNQLGH